MAFPESVAALPVAAGLALVALGLADIFLTILHPDRDGPASVALNRATWRVAVALASVAPRFAREIAALAGGLMIAATIVLWMALQVLGFALLAWPYLDTGFDLHETAGATFLDALYWSAITFTTLGFGDIVPITPLWKIVALAEALAGVALVGAAITFLLSVYQGIDHRDRMSLRIYSETRRTWDGTTFVLRVLDEEGPEALRRKLEAWAEQMRALHERLYRFQPLAFYVRTRSEKHEPERMLEAVGEVALTARLIARLPGFHAVRPAADEIDIAYTEFAHSAIHHHGSRTCLRALDDPQPTPEDREALARLWTQVARELDLPDPPTRDPVEEREILELATRIRVFLDELDRITRWRRIHLPPSSGRALALGHR
ncbi:MAG: potassium channel family protein [Gemmatimonadota bacterium]